MFKKLKDKLAEEVKSSPQRIQQFAQAAQVNTRVSYNQIISLFLFEYMREWVKLNFIHLISCPLPSPCWAQP